MHQIRVVGGELLEIELPIDGRATLLIASCSLMRRKGAESAANEVPAPDVVDACACLCLGGHPQAHLLRHTPPGEGAVGGESDVGSHVEEIVGVLKCTERDQRVCLRITQL